MHEENELPKVSQKQSEAEFDKWADAMDLDLDTSVMDVEDQKSFEKMKRRMLIAMQRGDLVLNEEDEMVYTPKNPKSGHHEPITFRERTGSALMAMDKRKAGHDVSKTYAVMGNMCGVHPNIFAKLVGIDGKVCEAVFSLLMD